MTKDPRILITNDDGIDAPGLAVAIEIARAVSDDVHVLAPATNQSGVGHRFSFGTELEIERRGPDLYALDGTPADCVVAGMTHPDLFGGHEPEVVLSGVNNGQNLGDIINCSGTIAGAREAAMQGALGIAMSQAVDFENGFDVSWDSARMHGAAILRALIAEKRRPGIYYNVNFPLAPAETVAGVRVVPHQRFARSPIAYYPSHNNGKFFIAIPHPPRDLNPDADFHILSQDRAVTVTPLKLDQSDLDATAGLQTLCDDSFSGAANFAHETGTMRASGGDGDAVRYKPDRPATAK